MLTSRILHKYNKNIEDHDMFMLIIYRCIIILSCCLISSTQSQKQGKLFEIFPSTKIVVDKGDDVTVTCKYNGYCDASLYKEGNELNPVWKVLNRTNITWKQNEFQNSWAGKYICKLTNCVESANNGKTEKLEIEVRAKSPPRILLHDNLLKKITVNSYTSFRLSLTGSPMPQMNCTDNGEHVIFCSSEDMKKVMYDNPSRLCKSSDQHYQIRSEQLQTVRVVFDIVNVTFAKDNGSTIYCYWKNDDGAEKNISMQIMVIDKIFEILPSTKIVVDEGGNATATCRYNGDCDASFYMYKNSLFRDERERSNITNNDIKELTLEYVDVVQEAYGGIYFCQLTNCAQSANNGKKRLEIEVRDKFFFEISPSEKKIVVDKGDSVTVTCRYNGNCDASLYKKGDPLNLIKELKRSKNDQSTIRKDTKELTWKYQNIQESYKGIYFCELTDCAQSTNNGNKSFEIDLKEPRIITKYEKNYDNKMMIGIIIGCVLLLLIGVIIGTALYCRERKLKNTYKTHLHSSGLVNPNKPLNEQVHELTYDKDWEFPFKRLGPYTTCLGEGNFGKVVKGKAYNIELLDPRNKSQQARTIRSQLWKSSKKLDIENIVTVTSTDVAIKTVKDGAPLEETRNLIGELKLMMHIGQHEHIVNLLGVSYKGYKLRGILEYCPNGDLGKFILKKRNSYQPTWVKTNHNEDKRFTLADQVTIAKQVAEGMQFLSSKKCVHRDLAARNILLAENYVVKIADFGIARKVTQDYTYKINRNSIKLPYKWVAIESLSNNMFTEKSDVWSFGILLWEIMTLGDVPYHEMPCQEMKIFLNTGKRLERPDNCTDELYGIMLDCWKSPPECRPSFQDINGSLSSLLAIKLSASDFEENMNVTDLPPMEENDKVSYFRGQHSSTGSSYVTIAQIQAIELSTL